MSLIITKLNDINLKYQTDFHDLVESYELSDLTISADFSPFEEVIDSSVVDGWIFGMETSIHTKSSRIDGIVDLHILKFNLEKKIHNDSISIDLYELVFRKNVLPIPEKTIKKRSIIEKRIYDYDLFDRVHELQTFLKLTKGI